MSHVDAATLLGGNPTRCPERRPARSYTIAGVFSFVSWPFSLKILWAPVVDSIFVRSIGLRRTWLIPVQARHSPRRCSGIR